MKIIVGLTTIIIILLAILLFAPAKRTTRLTDVLQTTPTKTPPDKTSDEPINITTYEGVESYTEEKDAAIQKGKKLFQEKLKAEISMANGPCLSEEIISDWVVDIAHNPRQATDNLPENQCQSYRAGKTHHFVELDPSGNLIRAL